MYALDTNTLIYYFKGLGGIPERLQAESPEDIAIPSLVLHELETGIAKSTNPERRRNQLDRVLTVFEILPFRREEAEISAAIRAYLERRGTPIGQLDLLIAATAIGHGATIVTHNTREFGRVPQLRIVDWYRED